MIKIVHINNKYKVKELRNNIIVGVFKPDLDNINDQRRLIVNCELGIFHIVSIYENEYKVVSEIGESWDDSVVTKTNDKILIEF